LNEYGQGIPQNYGEAFRWFQKAAEQGDTSAQFALGVKYASGKGVPQNDRMAFSWYRKAAEQGEASAQNNLGFMYERGRSVPQDYAEAVKWYRKAAEQGNALALRGSVPNLLKLLSEFAIFTPPAIML
jgi:TPR repeat protein